MNSNWTQTTLGDLISKGVAEVQTGPFGTVLKAAEYSKTGVPLISVGEIRHGYLQVSAHTPRISEKTKYRLPEYILKDGDIVFGRKGAIDRNAIIKSDQEGWFLGSDGIRLRLKERCNSLFLSYQLRCPAIGEWLLRNSSGSIMPSLNQKILDRLPIWLTDTSEQIAIAKTLSALDAKIGLNNQINAELEAMAKLLYDYWFVQFDFPMTAAQAASLGQPGLEGKPYKSSGGQMVHNAALNRQIPEDWETIELRDAIELKYGKAFKRDPQNIGVIPVYGSGGVYDYHNQKLVDGPGIIVGRKGSVGTIYWETGDFFASDTAYYVGPRKIKDLLFIYQMLKMLKLENMNSDSAVPGLSRERAYLLNITIPPLALINKFTKIVKPQAELKAKLKQQNQELTQLRDWLLPMLMNGQVTVGEVAVN